MKKLLFAICLLAVSVPTANGMNEKSSGDVGAEYKDNMVYGGDYQSGDASKGLQNQSAKKNQPTEDRKEKVDNTSLKDMPELEPLTVVIAKYKYADSLFEILSGLAHGVRINSLTTNDETKIKNRSMLAMGSNLLSIAGYTGLYFVDTYSDLNNEGKTYDTTLAKINGKTFPITSIIKHLIEAATAYNSYRNAEEIAQFNGETNHLNENYINLLGLLGANRTALIGAAYAGYDKTKLAAQILNPSWCLYELYLAALNNKELPQETFAEMIGSIAIEEIEPVAEVETVTEVIAEEPAVEAEEAILEVVAEAIEPAAEEEIVTENVAVEVEPVIEAEEFVAEVIAEETEPVAEAEEVILEVVTEEITPPVEAEEFAPEVISEEIEPVVETEEVILEVVTEEITPPVEAEELAPEDVTVEIEPAVEVEEIATDVANTDAEPAVEPAPAVETEELASEDVSVEVEPAVETEEIVTEVVAPKVETPLQKQRKTSEILWRN